MPVFLSYSHDDHDFANRLAVQLVHRNVHVWFDRWELNVGDSLLAKIQGALTDASALLVVLSRASVVSPWCSKEINAGLLRELEERRVVVLPVLVQDCDIPIFLREKLYADFRSNFDEGLARVVESIARVTNQWQSRVVEPRWHTDWAVDWGSLGDLVHVRISAVEQAEAQPYSILSTVEITGDPAATLRFERLREDGQEDNERRRIVGLLARAVEAGLDLTFTLSDQFEKRVAHEIVDPLTGAAYAVLIGCRRLGEDTGKNVLLRLGNQICQVYGHMVATSR